jgi:hypothetical protein
VASHFQVTDQESCNVNFLLFLNKNIFTVTAALVKPLKYVFRRSAASYVATVTKYFGFGGELRGTKNERNH